MSCIITAYTWKRTLFLYIWNIICLQIRTRGYKKKIIYVRQFPCTPFQIHIAVLFYLFFVHPCEILFQELQKNKARNGINFFAHLRSCWCDFFRSYISLSFVKIYLTNLLDEFADKFCLTNLSYKKLPNKFTYIQCITPKHLLNFCLTLLFIIYPRNSAL